MKGHLRRWLLCGAAATAILGALGGFAYAKATSDTTISACAKTASGQLRLDTGDGCLASEQAIQWNQTGPQGLQGIPGPAGTSNTSETGFYNGVGTGKTIVTGTWPSIRPNMTTVLTKHLDKGQYAITAEVMMENDSGVGIIVCLVGNDSLGYALAQSAVGNSSGYAKQATMSPQSTFPVPSAQDIAVRCFNADQGQPAGNPQITFADIMATKVDSTDFAQQP